MNLVEYIFSFIYNCSSKVQNTKMGCIVGCFKMTISLPEPKRWQNCDGG